MPMSVQHSHFSVKKEIVQLHFIFFKHELGVILDDVNCHCLVLIHKKSFDDIICMM